MKPTIEEQILLDDILNHLESKSSLEVVIVFYPTSGKYPWAGFWLGNILLWATLLFGFFVNTGLDFYIFLILAFVMQVFGFLLSLASPFLRRLFTSKVHSQRQCELVARAIFQKARLFQTSRQSAFLVFVSGEERQVTLLWDLGVDMKIPMAELRQWRMDFQGIFKESNAIHALSRCIRAITPIAAQYMPSIPGNANELPNRMNVKLWEEEEED